MAPTNPTDHDLNALLARVVGVEIAEFRPEEWYCVANPADIASGSMRWNPLHDANQMERVKATLREMGVDYGYEYKHKDEHVAHIYINRGHGYDPPILYRSSFGESELRAFALAVWAWWNEQNKEKAICTDNVK